MLEPMSVAQFVDFKWRLRGRASLTMLLGRPRISDHI